MTFKDVMGEGAIKVWMVVIRSNYKPLKVEEEETLRAKEGRKKNKGAKHAGEKKITTEGRRKQGQRRREEKRRELEERQRERDTRKPRIHRLFFPIYFQKKTQEALYRDQLKRLFTDRHKVTDISHLSSFTVHNRLFSSVHLPDSS